MSTRAPRLLVLLLAVALCGCASPKAAPVGAQPQEPRSVLAGGPALVFDSCVARCGESNVARDARTGVILVTTAIGDRLAASADGVHYASLPRIPLPEGAPADALGADSWITSDAHGRIYYVTPLLANASPLISLQVASTPDDGRTWDRNVLVALMGNGHDDVAGTDRPWVGIAPDGTVYLSYNNVASGIWLARSKDGGLTFSSFLPVTMPLGNAGPTSAGPPVVDTKGTLFIPYFSELRSTPHGDPTSDSLMVAVSEDGGATFTHHEVRDATGQWFPILALGPQDELDLAWASLDGHVYETTSLDGGATWPQRVDVSGTDASAGGPWIASGARGASVLWFERTSPGTYDLVASRLASGIPTRLVVATNVTGASGGPQKGDTPNTDFASFALMPDGSLATVWSDAKERSLYAALVAPASAS